jgi:hypothetical protein
VSETGRYTRGTGVVTPLEDLDQLEPDGSGLGCGAYPLVTVGNFRSGFTGWGREVTVNVYGLAVTMPQG